VCRVRENLYPPRNRVEVVPHVDEPLDTFGWRFGRTDRDYCRSRIECEPFGGRYDGEGFEWAVKGERTCRYTIVEMSLKPRDPDPEWLAFGDLKLESETPRSCERGCKGLTRFVRNAAADEERSGLCHLAWVLSVGTEDTRTTASGRIPYQPIAIPSAMKLSPAIVYNINGRVRSVERIGNMADQRRVRSRPFLISPTIGLGSSNSVSTSQGTPPGPLVDDDRVSVEAHGEQGYQERENEGP